MKRRRKPAGASLVVALRSLEPHILVDVLDQIGADLREPVTITKPRPPRLCGYCRLPYPRCRAQFADDHAFEGPLA